MPKLQVKVGSTATVHLLDSDFVASGGEGTVYKKGDVIYKVYHPQKMGLGTLENKIKLLSKISHIGIVAPLEVLYNTKGYPCGFTMPFVDGEVLVRYFNNDYRKTINYGIKETIETAYGMRDIVFAAHAAGALIVDGNEMNYIVTSKDHPCIIDVDSWQIGSYKATAIMASIRDYHSSSTSFSELTDWFSWAIVSFQLFTGIHPYKGRHPKYKVGDLIQRMEKNISIFNKEVLLPASARDVKDIPPNLLNWYESVFEKGSRGLPPDRFDAIVQPRIIQKTVYKTTGKLKFVKLREFESDIVKVYPNNVVLTKDKIFTRSSRSGINLSWIYGAIGRNFDYKFHCVSTEEGTVVLKDNMPGARLIDGDSYQALSMGTQITKFFSGNNRFFSVQGDRLTEINVVRIGTQRIFVTGTSWNVGLNSTRFGEGAGLYDALGTQFIVLPYGDKGVIIEKFVYQLGDRRLIDIKAIDKFVTCLVKDKSGQNFKYEVYYSAPLHTDQYETATDETGLNFAVNERGTVATIVEDGELVLFSPETGKSAKVSDKHIKSDMQLQTYNGNIAFIKENELWSLSMS